MNSKLSYQDILKICKEINEKHIPKSEPFEVAIDNLYEKFNDIELRPIDFILEVYKSLLIVVDKQIENIEEKMNIKPSCFKGCAHCCYFPIIVSRLEAKLIVQFIRSLPQKESEKIITHLNRYFEENQQMIEDNCSLDFNEDSDFKRKYIGKQLSCPLLDTDTNTCLAYRVRPIPCRTYLNYSDPIVCRDSFIPKEPFSYDFIHGNYMEELNGTLQDFIYDDVEVEGVNYPDDIFEYNYLPILLKQELDL